jgi:hypothetical protein
VKLVLRFSHVTNVMILSFSLIGITNQLLLMNIGVSKETLQKQLVLLIFTNITNLMGVQLVNTKIHLELVLLVMMNVKIVMEDLPSVQHVIQQQDQFW